MNDKIIVEKQEERNGIQILFLKSYSGSLETLFFDEVKVLVGLGSKNFIFDLSKVTWMNSVDLGFLMGALTVIRNHNGSLKLIGVQETIKNLLVITKLIMLFDIYESIGAAIQAFQTQPDKS